MEIGNPPFPLKLMEPVTVMFSNLLALILLSKSFPFLEDRTLLTLSLIKKRSLRFTLSLLEGQDPTLFSQTYIRSLVSKADRKYLQRVLGGPKSVPFPVLCSAFSGSIFVSSSESLAANSEKLKMAPAIKPSVKIAQ